MPWDPSIPLQGGGPANILPNPLEFFGGLQALQKRQHENLLFQQQNDARVATGDAYAKAVGPDGSLDEGKLMELLRSNPAAQFAIPEALAAAQKREQERLAIQQKNLELGSQRLSMFANTLGGLMIKGDAITDADVHTAVSKLAVQIGDPKLAKTMFLGLADMPKKGPELQKWITQQNAAVMPVVDRMNMALGTAVPVDDGGGIKMLSQNKLTGTIAPLGGTSDIEKMPTPAERNAQGVPRSDPETGAPLPPKTAAEERNLTGGRGTPIAAQPVPTGPIGIAPPKAEENLKTMGDYWNYRDKLNENLSSGEQALMQMRSMRNLMDLTRTGPGQETRVKVATAAAALGLPQNVVSAINGGDLFAAQEFAKKSFQAAYEQLKLMSPPGTQLTQGEVLTNWESSARTAMDPRAIEGLFNFATKVFEYKKEEREFYRNWEGAPKDARAAWTDKALKEGLLKPEIRERGPGPGITTPRELYSRGAGVPTVGEVPEAELSRIPDGRSATITKEDGTKVRVKRTGSKFEVLR